MLMISKSDHLKNIKADTSESGFWVMGGATLDEPIREGQPIKINGSVMMALADSKEEVLARLETDVYYKGEVWDKEKVMHIVTAHATTSTQLTRQHTDPNLPVQKRCTRAASVVHYGHIIQSKT